MFTIAMVTEQVRPGQVAALAAALARLGHDVVAHPRDPDVSVNDFGRHLAEQWRQQPPDVVHSHSPESGVAALLAAGDIPVVHTFHCLGSPADQRLDRLIGQHAARSVATCSESVFELLGIGARRSRVSVVPYGVDITMFSPCGPIAPRGERHRLLAVGLVLDHRDYDTAIAALPHMPDAELVIAGGPEAELLSEDAAARSLWKLAEHFDVGDRVKLLGGVAHQDMPALLRSADVVVCTPRHAPAGTVALEAMACGMPVVAEPTGGLVDMVVDNVTGRLVPPRDPAAFAKVIRPLLANPMVRGAFGAAGRDRVEARYSWDRIALDTTHAYHRAGAVPREPVVLSAAH
ncbi:glycosyltransferase [Kutzneria buriramensis]|uniref:Glycosyltransferase involved in cell wall biosynthesis n=1 Tax=Kutzneria buriramensis TaxID=1045776 RepID=A0A3E0H779_9PSEU|nr:glycosyltransferase [Kutzneria buriramensis]REH39275.1 glycosyltransferase involved in cell wall biosynthesis [Kutzneria buriramensis]